MKHVFGIIILLTITACDSSETTKSKSCTYNGEPVDCSALESGSRSSISNSELSLTASVSTEISLLDNSIEVLENSYDIASKTLEGKTYDCETSTNAGDVFDYSLVGDELQLTKDGRLEAFTRVKGDKNKLFGTWKNIEKDSEGSIILTLILTEESMDITVNCNFN
jgi:hypothetical protein